MSLESQKSEIPWSIMSKLTPYQVVEIALFAPTLSSPCLAGFFLHEQVYERNERATIRFLDEN